MQLNESPNINIPDCTNIDVNELERIYLRMDLYETLQNAFSDVRKVMNYPSIEDIHTCAWMNNRVLNNCAVQNNLNYGHRDTLNKLCDPDSALNHIVPRGCDPQLCTMISPF